MSQRRLRLPLHVEEDHHHVLTHILNGVGSKRLPLEDSILLHFDSHPDLLLPRNLTPDKAGSKRDLLAEVSIENWILPCAYLGLINRIIWVCPPWSQQIPRGLHQFHIGRQKSTDKIRVTCTESYFISEGIVCNRSELDSERPVSLLVVQIDEANVAKTINDFIGPNIDEDTSLIVDVDLDFFSTKNPFVDMYAEAGLYARLKELYVFEAVPAGLTDEAKTAFALESCAKRTKLLDRLEDLFKYLSEHDSLEGYSGIGLEYLDKVVDVKDAVETHYEGKVDWLLIHDAGCTCDDTDLPHHVSSAEEIEQLMMEADKLLAALALQSPKMLTVARSSLDEFCPPEQVEMVQERALEVLRGRYREVEVHLDYKDE